jgi:exodeoxyribonuclease-1
MSFVFYDTETTGTNTVFDQILQFAAIHTDDELNEIETINLRCRLLPHVVPSREAMQITGLTAAELTKSDLPSHYTMIRAIRGKLLEWSPSLFLGWNSLGFDEHLLRQALYQTLHRPYLTNIGRNCRADALRLARLTVLLAPDALSIPVNEQGARTFRLHGLAAANGYQFHRAHDALDDVRACIHLCKLISENAPEVWSTFLRFTQKSTVQDFLGSELVFCLIDFFSGEVHSWLLGLLGPSTSRRADMLGLNLAEDPGVLGAMSDEELAAKFSDNPRIVRRIRTNACPFLSYADDAPDLASAKSLGRDELERRATMLRDDAALRNRLIAAFEQTARQHPPGVHVEQQIHDAFISDADEQRLEEFHAAEWENRIAILDELDDRRLRQLGRRLIFLERPDVLPEGLRREMTAMVARRVIKGDGSETWLCLEKAIADVDRLVASATGEEATRLAGHREFLAGRLADLSAHLDAQQVVDVAARQEIGASE